MGRESLSMERGRESLGWEAGRVILFQVVDEGEMVAAS